jgi:ribonuclease P protein component
MPHIARRITLWTKLEITTLFKRASRISRCSGLDVRVAPASSELGRLLIIIPGKSGNAPQRALLRRRLKAVFYERQLYQKGYDWIFLARKEALLLPFDQLEALVLELVSKLLSSVS